MQNIGRLALYDTSDYNNELQYRMLNNKNREGKRMRNLVSTSLKGLVLTSIITDGPLITTGDI